MKVRSIVFFLSLFVLVATNCLAADDAFMGTWKLNESKSKIAAGAPKNQTVLYEAAGDSTKVIIDGITADGTPVHSEWTGKFDGKDYPSTGNPNEDMRSARKINEHTYDVESKKGGKVLLTAHVVVAPDGKTRTVTTHGTDSKGKKYTSVAVYEKQ